MLIEVHEQERAAASRRHRLAQATARKQQLKARQARDRNGAGWSRRGAHAARRAQRQA
jgi:hypothetical protein